MRKIMIAAAIATLCAGPALAADDAMAGYYGNTVVSTGGGIESHTHYRADHTFDSTLTGMGQTFVSKGTWALDAQGQICRTYETAPPGMPNPVCIAGGAHKVGDNWTVTVSGQARDVTLKAGVE